MQRKVQVINGADDPAALEQALREWISKKPQTEDEYRDANANHVRAVLLKAYAKMDPVWFCRDKPDQVDRIRGGMVLHPQAFVAAYYGEDHAYAIMQEWLLEYDRLAKLRAKSDPDIGRIVACAETLGKLYERLYWRAGKDPETGERREALALQTRNSWVALVGDRDGSRANANAARHETAEAWREVAREVAASAPFGGARLENRILAELRQRGFPDRSGPAIRKAIKGIRRID